MQQNWQRQGQSYAPGHTTFIIIFQGKANLIACIRSFAMALSYSFDPDDEATRIDNVVENGLDDGLHAADLLGE